MDDADAQSQPFWPELEEIARAARERRRLVPAERSEIIVRLCGRAALSVRELSILLDRSEAYVGDAIRPLLNAGQLTFLYPDQPRHPRQKYMAAAKPSTQARQFDFPEPSLPQDRLRERDVEREAGFAPRSPGPAIPNRWTNLTIALLAGLLAGLTGMRLWWLLALTTALLVSWWHIRVDSAQFRQFSLLSLMGNKARGFVLMKSPVTFVEISLVYLAVRVLAGSAE
ncbi:MAG TPA: hypothetical protein VFO52_11855 [Longimicrobiales bacterium]|nr:hypothetical protein [Longimicrobiales bacterium]